MYLVLLIIFQISFIHNNLSFSENPDADSNGKSGGSEGSGPMEGLFYSKNQAAASNEYPEGNERFEICFIDNFFE